MSLEKEGIEYFNRVSFHVGGDPQKTRNALSEEHTKLCSQILATRAGNHNPETVHKLQVLDVALAAAQWTDLNHPNARQALDNAAKGFTNGNGRLYSRVLIEEGQPRPTDDRTPDRVTVRPDHTGKML